MKKFKWYLLMFLLLSIAVILVISISNFSRGGVPTKEEQAVLRIQCAPIIKWLDSEYKKKRRFPKELPPEYQTILRSLPYPAKYELFGDMYDISIGTYSVWAPFVYSYDSKDKKWYLDN